MLSGELARYIVENEKIDEATARKRIQRLKTPIHKLKCFFADNQSFLYHTDNYNSADYFSKLEDAFSVSAKRCHAIVTAIKYHHGIIAKAELPNYSFNPTSKIRGHFLYSNLVQRLKDIKVLMEYDDNHFCLNGYLANKAEPNFRHYKAIQFAKSLVLNQFSDWGRNIGLISFKKDAFNREIGGFQFGFAAPTYINGFVQYKEGTPKPGFVVADVLIGNTTKISEVEFFLQKITAIRASNPTLRIFPILLIDGVDINALNQLKRIGVLIASIKEIFGNAYTHLLKSLINLITNAGAILKKNPERYIKLMAELTKLVDGKTNNLRGDLFELAVGYYYGKQCQSLDIGKRFRNDDDFKAWEIDVLAIYENEIRIVECKGYNYPVNEEYIEKYLSEKIHAIRKWIDRFYPDKKQLFEIWSTGGFTETATSLLATAKGKTRRYTIDFLGKQEIVERAGQLHGNKLTDLLKEYFFKDL